MSGDTPRKPVYVAWSGGIDSTALIGALLSAGRDVAAITVPIYEMRAPFMHLREFEARRALIPHLEKLAESRGCLLSVWEEGSAEWIWAFAAKDDPLEIPTRNKRLIDHILATRLGTDGGELGLGEYTGVDTWVVQDHVDGLDCDTRSLSSYLFIEYGIKYRLWTLDDFTAHGSVRYKSGRLRLCLAVLGGEATALTTNCLKDTSTHCGACYKCIERAAAYEMNNLPDPTKYGCWPKADMQFEKYYEQMSGPE